MPSGCWYSASIYATPHSSFTDLVGQLRRRPMRIGRTGPDSLQAYSHAVCSARLVEKQNSFVVRFGLVTCSSGGNSLCLLPGSFGACCADIFHLSPALIWLAGVNSKSAGANGKNRECAPGRVHWGNGNCSGRKRELPIFAPVHYRIRRASPQARFGRLLSGRLEWSVHRFACGLRFFRLPPAQIFP